MDEFLPGTGLHVNLLLCDAAQSNGGKLFILGGGLSMVGPRPQPLALALWLTVPWDRANIKHEWHIDLLDEDGRPVLLGEKPVIVKGRFEAGRPAGTRPGTPLGVALAVNITPLPLPGGRSYTFALTIEEESRPDWRVSFFVRAPKEQQS